MSAPEISALLSRLIDDAGARSPRIEKDEYWNAVADDLKRAIAGRPAGSQVGDECVMLSVALRNISERRRLQEDDTRWQMIAGVLLPMVRRSLLSVLEVRSQRLAPDQHPDYRKAKA